MPDRITPYEPGGSVEDRIDEVVRTGVDVHIEMLSGSLAWVQIGKEILFFQAQRGQRLVLRYGGREA